MLSSKKARPSLPSRPEPPKLDSINQDIEGAADDDVAFTFFTRQSQGLLDESATSIESQVSPEDEDTQKNIRGGVGVGLRHRFGDVMAAASDAIHKQKAPPDADKPLAKYDGDDDVVLSDGGAAKVASSTMAAPMQIEESYKNVLSFLDANRRLQMMLGKTGEKFDQSFESVGEGKEEDFLDPVDDDDFADQFQDDDSLAATSIGALGGDTIAECDDYLPRDKRDNFQDLVTKLDKLKQELSLELADLVNKTTT